MKQQTQRGQIQPTEYTHRIPVLVPLTGVVLATFIVSTLASSRDTAESASTLFWDLSSVWNGQAPDTEQLRSTTTTLLVEDVGSTILDAALPLSPTDLVTTSLGEATAGVAATASSLVASLWLSRDQNTGTKQSISITTETLIEEEIQASRIPASSRSRKQTTSQGLSALDSNEIWKQQQLNYQYSGSNNKNNQRRSRRREFRRKAVTDGDYLIGQAATEPILEALLGLSPLVAIVGSVLLSAIPAGIVNFAARQRMIKEERQDRQTMLMEEDDDDVGNDDDDNRSRQLALLQVMLTKEEETRKLIKPFPFNLFSPTTPQLLIQEQQALQELEGIRRVRTTADPDEDMKGIVLVDTITDLIKWLGYRVIGTQFSGQLIMFSSEASMTIGGISSHAEGDDILFMQQFLPLESAVFGVAAALSAQLYADLFVAIFAFGGATKQEEIQSRSMSEWIATYFQVAVSAAALFGVYELAQLPAKALISAIVSGGAENCYGSQDYHLCLETYLVNNPPDPSPEAQIRSFITSVVSIWNRMTGN